MEFTTMREKSLDLIVESNGKSKSNRYTKLVSINTGNKKNLN